MGVSARAKAALAGALRFLREQQSPDGAWRSETYGTFKEGDALTPLVTYTLGMASAEPGIGAAARKGAAFLASMVSPAGAIVEGPYGLSYPVYTAALAVLALGHPSARVHYEARAAWLAYLRGRQLTEAFGWRPGDPEYGGWGYAQSVLQEREKPHAPPLALPNISATVFALEALSSVERDDPDLARGLQFLRRCQNFADEPTQTDAAFDDGGFFFMHGDAFRNKAGAAGNDRTGRPRYTSYGSATADGLRGLLACGLPVDHERVLAARTWLERNFCTASNPGDFACDRKAMQASVYYYYCWSLSRALTACGIETLAASAGPVCWAEALAEELMRRQRPDGSWLNDAVEMREDDPIVATCLATGALARLLPS